MCLLVDGGSFTVWKVGTKTVVMTIFLLGHLEEKHGKTKTNQNHETVPLNPCRRWWWCCGGQPREPGATKTGKTWWRLQTGCNRVFKCWSFPSPAFNFLVKLCQFHLLPVNHQWTTSEPSPQFILSLIFQAAPKLTAWLQAELAPRSGASKTRNTTWHVHLARLGFFAGSDRSENQVPDQTNWWNFARQTHIKPAFAERGSPFAEIIRSSMALCTGWTADWSFWLIWMRWPIGHV